MLLAESGRLGVIMSNLKTSIFWGCVLFLLTCCGSSKNISSTNVARNDSTGFHSWHFSNAADSVYIREVICDTIKGDTLIHHDSSFVYVSRGEVVRQVDTLKIHHYKTDTITKTIEAKPTFRQKLTWGCYGVVFICIFLVLLIVGRNVVHNVRRILGKE